MEGRGGGEGEQRYGTGSQGSHNGGVDTSAWTCMGFVGSGCTVVAGLGAT